MPIVLERNIANARLLLWEITEDEACLREMVLPEDVSSAQKFSSGRRRLEHLAWRAALRSVVRSGDVVYDENGAPEIRSFFPEDVFPGPAVPPDAKVKPAGQSPHGNGLPTTIPVTDSSPSIITTSTPNSISTQSPTTLSSSAVESHRGGSVGDSHTYSRLFLSAAHTSGMAAVLISESPCAVDIENIVRPLDKIAVRFVSPQERNLAHATDPLFETALWCAKEALYKYSGRIGLDFLQDLRITSADLDSGRLTGRITNGEPVDIPMIRFGEYVVACIV